VGVMVKDKFKGISDMVVEVSGFDIMLAASI
jgi:hypothetical protein